MPRAAAPLALVALLAACAASSDSPPAAPVAATASEGLEGDARRPVLVELFTSEGCSSCPPADRLLARLDAEAAETGVVALSFHVDYWDRLGWRDPYSDAANTARQRAYAASLDGRVYTPEMVVGGTAGFVGSREGEARQAIQAARPPTAEVALTPTRAGDEVQVAYGVAGAPDGARLHLALVQPEAVQQVTRGENRGQRLRHVRVVRAFTTVAAGTGTATLRVPAGVTEARVVGFVQPGAVGAVLGIAEVGV